MELFWVRERYKTAIIIKKNWHTLRVHFHTELNGLKSIKLEFGGLEW